LSLIICSTAGLSRPSRCGGDASGGVDTTFGPITVPIISGTGLAVQGDGKVLFAGFVEPRKHRHPISRWCA